MKYYTNQLSDLIELMVEEDGMHSISACLRVLTECRRMLLARQAAGAIQNGTLMGLVDRIVQQHQHEEIVLRYAGRIVKAILESGVRVESDLPTLMTDSKCIELMCQGLGIFVSNERYFLLICDLISTMCFDAPLQPHEENQFLFQSYDVFENMHVGMEECQSLELDKAIAQTTISLCYSNPSNVEAAFQVGLFSRFISVVETSDKVTPAFYNIARAFFVALDAHDTIGEKFAKTSLMNSLVLWVRPDNNDYPLIWQALKTIEIYTRKADEVKDQLIGCKGLEIFADFIRSLLINNPNVNSIIPYAHITSIIMASAATDAAGVADQERILHHLEQHMPRHVFFLYSKYPRQPIILEQIFRVIEIFCSNDKGRQDCSSKGALRFCKLTINAMKDEGVLSICDRLLKKLTR